MLKYICTTADIRDARIQRALARNIARTAELPYAHLQIQRWAAQLQGLVIGEPRAQNAEQLARFKRNGFVGYYRIYP